MTLLPAGTFRVSDFRKDIPEKIKVAVLKRDCEVDHDPGLLNRPYDTEAGDFIPPQWDMTTLVGREKAKHAHKTFGRVPGAAKTVTTRGSDVGERARTRGIRASEARHGAVLLSKIWGSAPPAEKPKHKIQSKGFDKRMTKGFDGKVRPRKARRT